MMKMIRTADSIRKQTGLGNDFFDCLYIHSTGHNPQDTTMIDTKSLLRGSNTKPLTCRVYETHGDHKIDGGEGDVFECLMDTADT
jgi:hypothetical protein